MILVDEEGQKIYCSVHYTLIPDFAPKLEEGRFRMISNFEVESTKSMFLLAKHPCKLSFVKDTSVGKSTTFENTNDMFEFCSFKRINNWTVDKNASFGKSL